MSSRTEVVEPITVRSEGERSPHLFNLNCGMRHPFHSKLLKQSAVSRVNWRRIYSGWTYSRGCFVWFYISSQSFCILHQLCTKLDHMLINHYFSVVCFTLYKHCFICLLSLCKLYFFFFFLYIIHIFLYIIICMNLNRFLQSWILAL